MPPVTANGIKEAMKSVKIRKLRKKDSISEYLRKKDSEEITVKIYLTSRRSKTTNKNPAMILINEKRKLI